MSENNETLEKKSNDEVSLLDLLAVLIRRRKLITFSTIIVFVASILWLFVIPKFKKTASERKVQVIYSGNVEKISPELASYLNFDLINISDRELKSYVNFANIQKKYNIFTNEDMTLRQYNFVIKQLIDQKNFYVSMSRGNNSFQIISSVNESQVEEYQKFITEYVEYCSKIIEGNLLQAIEFASINIDELIERSEASENSSSDLANLISLRLSIKNYTDTHQQTLIIDDNPFEIDMALGRMKKVLVATITAFFISIFIAFLLNTIENIKKDPEASKLISDAWKAGK